VGVDARANAADRDLETRRRLADLLGELVGKIKGVEEHR
jgi:hypothetical protein